MKNKLLKRTNGGFSLVELIVVIAIMAILVGVAVPVYSSYIEKSQKTTDTQLVDEVAHALTVYSITNSGRGGYVVLTPEGVECVADEFGNEAMTKMFGDNWKDELYLKYTQWVAEYYGGVDSVVNNTGAAQLTDSMSVLTNLAGVVVGSNEASKATDIIADLFGTDEATKNSILAELSQYEGDENYSTIASNLIVKYAANQVGQAEIGEDDNGDAIITIGGKDVEGISYLALQYSMLYTMANSDHAYKGAAQDKIDAFNETLVEISQKEQADSVETHVVQEAMDAFGLLLGDELTDADGNTLSFGAVYEDYLANGGLTDAEGIIAAMNVLGDVSKNYSDVESLSNPNFFQSTSVVNLVEAYQAAATKGGVLISISEVGEVTVMPAEARGN